MSEHVDSAADGEWPQDELSDAERRELEAARRVGAAFRARLEAGMPADLDQRVMRRVRQLGLEPLPLRDVPALTLPRRLVAALWSRRDVHIRFRPAYGLVTAVLIALVAVVGRTVSSGPSSPLGAHASSDRTRVFVQFSLYVEGATHVALAGSFSDWEPIHRLHHTADGVWTLMLPLEPGVYDYSFVVDGERWVPDPYAPQVDDGFGGVNSRITLLAAAEGS